jgi:hypothetical protein
MLVALASAPLAESCAAKAGNGKIRKITGSAAARTLLDMHIPFFKPESSPGLFSHGASVG